MSIPSSQICSVWVQEELTVTTWVPLRDILFVTLEKKLIKESKETLWDLVEEYADHVAEHLRNCVADCITDGAIPRFQIDDDPSPYVRLAGNVPQVLVEKLRTISPFEFEQVCSNVLTALGASSRTTRKSKDGGVDFIGIRLNVVPNALPVPTSSMIAVIGQAKRYKDGNVISETQLREFVGAATLHRHTLLKEGKMWPLSPVLFAFWTTSDFDRNAKQFARDLGLWFMDGVTLAGYITTLVLQKVLWRLTPRVIDSSR